MDHSSNGTSLLVDALVPETGDDVIELAVAELVPLGEADVRLVAVCATVAATIVTIKATGLIQLLDEAISQYDPVVSDAILRPVFRSSSTYQSRLKGRLLAMIVQTRVSSTHER